MQLVFTFFSKLFLTDGLNDFHPVYIYAQVSFYGSLGLWLRCGKYSGNCVRILCNGMNVGSRSAYIYGHHISDAVIKQLGTFHYSSRCRNDRSAYHVSHMFHSRCMGDVILKSLLNYLAAWFNIEGINLWINIVYQVEILSAFLVKDKLHFVLIFNISCVYYRCFKAHSSYHLGIVNCGVSFSVIHTACYENQVRVNFLDSGNIASSQSSNGYIVDYSACSQCRFLGCLGRHIVNQTVNCHFKAACR